MKQELSQLVWLVVADPVDDKLLLLDQEDPVRLLDTEALRDLVGVAEGEKLLEWVRLGREADGVALTEALGLREAVAL